MTKQLTKLNIGVGVAGTGFIGPAHVEGLRRNGINVLALAENTREKAQQKAVDLGIPRIYGSLDEMLADPEIDVVHLATPNYLHHPHAKAALLAGKHVICEKPLAMTSAESGELLQLTKERNLVHPVNFNIRMYPLSQQARTSNNEYKKQKPSAEFWLGLALRRGIEVYLPPGCMLMKSDLYGGNEQGAGWLGI